MAEYIEKEELLRKRPFCVAGGLVNDYTEGFCDCVDEARETIKNMPAADVAPVVHGRWIGKPLCGNANCRCSECGGVFQIHANLHGKVLQKYCPNCGAKMDGEEQDDE